MALECKSLGFMGLVPRTQGFKGKCWGYVGIMEKKMEVTVAYWGSFLKGYIGVILGWL